MNEIPTWLQWLQWLAALGVLGLVVWLLKNTANHLFHEAFKKEFEEKFKEEKQKWIYTANHLFHEACKKEFEEKFKEEKQKWIYEMIIKSSNTPQFLTLLSFLIGISSKEQRENLKELAENPALRIREKPDDEQKQDLKKAFKEAGAAIERPKQKD